MDSATLDLTALINVTNALVSLTNENTRLKEINAALSGRLREIELEQTEGQGAEDAPEDAHEG